MSCPFKVIVWTNEGNRDEFGCVSEREAMSVARNHRTPAFRTVKVGHDGDAIRHWTRSSAGHGNVWSACLIVECLC